MINNQVKLQNTDWHKIWIFVVEQIIWEHTNDISMHHTATYPQCLPITSRMKALWWLQRWDKNRQINVLSTVLCPMYMHVCVCMYLWAVVVMASTTSMILCRAESVPMVMSVPQKSLSMDPTIPTMFRWDERLASSAVILPMSKNRHVFLYKSLWKCDTLNILVKLLILY